MRISLSFLLLALGASAAANAAETETVVGKPDAAAKPVAEKVDAQRGPTTQAGVRVYVDPATGRRINHPTAEQRAAAAATDRDNPAFNTSSDGLVSKPLPGGGVLVHLDGRFRSSVSVHRNADGSLVQTCSDPMHESLGAGHAHAAPVVAPRDVR